MSEWGLVDGIAYYGSKGWELCPFHNFLVVEISMPVTLEKN